ncbi:hypothetical protein P3X46_018696 [Hevea brasiliensis]|uniref:Uncharacterized protein n=2 Tax=Hevea brasiliensis TaxID=3981 RepID=A0ABQ9LTM8_HEVBR|nr:probable membrane-associated kinase regulator 1 isoform X2 [Hevea brasiliensis]KAJ9170599.1 hypothetical protein P3X46_018696 [Hevea brasiliensis]KAJ9170600.1 hypothetical protein P3X46_018696 [Hevea brasiliensis]
MERNSAEETWEYSNFHKEEEEEEEEALSLCDLPVNLIKAETQSSKDGAQETEASQEDFDFVPWGGSLSTSSEMCAADDIFFQGQILPFRLSVSSESGLNKLRQDSLNPSRSLSRSESMDRGSIGGFTSFSSRSSSSRSQFSSSSTSSLTTSTRISKPRIQNQLHTHPSPKPQIRLSSTSLGNAGSNRNRKSTIWDFFRLGLVRTPEIELQDLKVRTSVSRNSSSSSSNSNSSIRISSNSRGRISSSKSQSQGENMEKQRKQSFLEKRSGGLLSGCSCTASAVKSVPLNIIIIKSSNSGGNSNNDKSKEKDSAEDMPQELKIKYKNKVVEKQQQQKLKQQGKQAMSSRRTFEWIKELSHASFLVDHEEEGLDS